MCNHLVFSQWDETKRILIAVITPPLYAPRLAGFQPVHF